MSYTDSSAANGTDGLQSIDIKPRRSTVSTPIGTAQMQSAIREYYSEGRWESLEQLCNIAISSFVKDLPTPILSPGHDIYAFHFGAIAFKNLNKKDNYLACLKVLFSIKDYASNLSSEDQELLNLDIDEYRSLSKELGNGYLNNINVSEVLKKSGCFIATAVYGSPYADEILVLQELRDNYILKYKLGKAFVKLYYWLSPPIADLIAISDCLKTITKAVLIIPMVTFANNLIKKEKQ